MKADLHSFYFDPDLGIIAALKGDPDQGYLVGLFDSHFTGLSHTALAGCQRRCHRIDANKKHDGFSYSVWATGSERLFL